MSNPDERLSPQQVADELGMTRQAVTRWIRTGLLPAQRIGLRKYQIKRSDLVEFIAAQQRREREEQRAKKANGLPAFAR